MPGNVSNHLMDYLAILVALISLVISMFFAIRSMQSNRRANELSENQKTASLIALLAPACKSPEQWELFIEFMANNNQLPSIITADQQFLIEALSRLEIKSEIIDGKFKVHQ